MLTYSGVEVQNVSVVKALMKYPKPDFGISGNSRIWNGARRDYRAGKIY